MKSRIAAYIRSGAHDESSFDEIALELYRWQRAHNAEYDAICGQTTVAGWRDIPTVHVSLFQDLYLCCFPPEEAKTVFRTSGTTVGRRGAHRLQDTEVYEIGALRHAMAMCGPIPGRGVGLVPSQPDSSLGHMCRSFVPDLRWCFSPDDGVDTGAAWYVLRGAAEPLFLPATAFAMAELLEGISDPCPLPEGSLVMVTGGYKGRSRDIPEQALASRVVNTFIGAQIVGEYGMTELSSQLWAPHLGAPYRPPPWMRVMAIDPQSRLPAEEGVLCFFDLANHQTVLAIETEDVGTVLADGTVILRGRLTGAPLRGCSLSAEEAGAGPDVR